MGIDNKTVRRYVLNYICLHTIQYREIVPRGGIPILTDLGDCMLMNFKGGPPLVDEIQRWTPH